MHHDYVQIHLNGKTKLIMNYVLVVHLLIYRMRYISFEANLPNDRFLFDLEYNRSIFHPNKLHNNPQIFYYLCQWSFDHSSDAWYFDLTYQQVSELIEERKRSLLKGKFSRLRRFSRNILHVNIFLVFLIRSIIQLIAELAMSKGYFAHNVFERIDTCNRTTIYFKEDKVQNYFPEEIKKKHHVLLCLVT